MQERELRAFQNAIPEHPLTWPSAILFPRLERGEIVLLGIGYRKITRHRNQFPKDHVPKTPPKTALISN